MHALSMAEFLPAFLLTLFAGLSTALGAIIAFGAVQRIRNFSPLAWAFLQVL
jgi:zinc transporter ZupT